MENIITIYIMNMRKKKQNVKDNETDKTLMKGERTNKRKSNTIDNY